MGFFATPIKLHVNGEDFGGVFINWDGVDSPVVTIRALATQLCLNGRKLAGEVMLHDMNHFALEQIRDKHAIPFLATRREEFAQAVNADAKFIFEDEDASGAPDVFEQMSTYSLVRVALDLGSPFLDWTIDFSKLIGIGTRFRMNKAVWDRCRATQSTLSMKDRRDVERYQKAFEALAPELDKLAEKIKAADDEAKKWREGTGSAALSALSLLTVTHEMVAVYSQQDPKADRIAARTRQLVEVVGNEVAKDAAAALRAKIDAIEKFYRDKGFNKKLYAYLDAWDPSIIYYFHAVAARATDADKKNIENFDARLFKSLARAAELLNQKAAHSRAAAAEFQRAVDATWKVAVEEGVAVKSPSTIDAKRDALLDGLLAETEAGWLTTLAVWSGMAMTYTGNMEGPPSIASMVLSAYAKTDHFINTLKGQDGLLRIVVMWGVDPVEHKAVLSLVKSNVKEARELGRKIFNNGSWRSTSVFATFYVFSAAVLVYHLNELAEAFADGKGGDFDAELLELTLPIVQDLLGFALIGFTHFYSNQMGGYLRTNGIQRLDELAAMVDTLETKTFAAKAARVAHVGLSVIGLSLAIWTFADESPTADVFEDWMLGLTVGAAAIGLMGVAVGGKLAFLGPWGFAAGVAIGLISAAYVRWFKPVLAKAMQGVGKQLLADAYLKSKGGVVAGKTSWVLWTSDVSLKEMLTEVVEELAEFDWQDKLNQAFLVDYSRAGLPPKMIAELYGIEESEVKKRLKAARTTARRRKLASIPTQINLVPPLEPGVELRVGAFNLIRLEVTHGVRSKLPNRIWLEVDLEDVNEFFDAGGQPQTTYDAAKLVVMMFLDSSTRFGRVYEGSFRLTKRPADGKLRFFAFAPEDKFAQGPVSGASALATRDLLFTVQP